MPNDIEAVLKSRFPAELINSSPAKEPRYHLFHAANSVCSQKVRTLLFEAGEPFYSRNVNTFAGESYDPIYVRVRAQACLDSGIEFASRHTGSTSATGTGCDACVVPTLVDDETGQVVVDSLRICRLLSDTFDGGFRPADLAAAIDREINVVDELPNYPLLAAKIAKPADGQGGNILAMAKVERCNKLISEHADEPMLLEAYTAKRDKELSANNDLFSNAAIARSESQMQEAFHALAQRLSDDRTYLFGDALSLADIFWAIELIRTDDLGYGDWIKEHPTLAAYHKALCATPSIRKAILDWPGARIKMPPH